MTVTEGDRGQRPGQAPATGGPNGAHNGAPAELREDEMATARTARMPRAAAPSGQPPAKPPVKQPAKQPWPGSPPQQGGHQPPNQPQARPQQPVSSRISSRISSPVSGRISAAAEHLRTSAGIVRLSDGQPSPPRSAPSPSGRPPMTQPSPSAPVPSPAPQNWAPAAPAKPKMSLRERLGLVKPSPTGRAEATEPTQPITAPRTPPITPPVTTPQVGPAASAQAASRRRLLPRRLLPLGRFLRVPRSLRARCRRGRPAQPAPTPAAGLRHRTPPVRLGLDTPCRPPRLPRVPHGRRLEPPAPRLPEWFRRALPRPRRPVRSHRMSSPASRILRPLTPELRQRRTSADPAR